jgi:cobalt/nickel transport system permease protein
VLGPVLGCSSALVVNILSAALGHGGWSLLGANFLVNSTEVLAGYYVFSGLSRLTHSKFSAAGISTVVALVSSNFLMVGMIVASGIQGSALSPIEIGINMLPLMVINVAAAVVEGVVTAFIVHYATALKPDLLSNSEAQRSSK